MTEDNSESKVSVIQGIREAINQVNSAFYGDDWEEDWNRKHLNERRIRFLRTFAALFSLILGLLSMVIMIGFFAMFMTEGRWLDLFICILSALGLSLFLTVAKTLVEDN